MSSDKVVELKKPTMAEDAVREYPSGRIGTQRVTFWMFLDGSAAILKDGMLVVATAEELAASQRAEKEQEDIAILSSPEVARRLEEHGAALDKRAK